ncbi:MAG: sulfotransferase family protein, partial [Planctomycetota bacterium]
MTKPVTIDRPIFILGPHRSGTTLLYKLLGRHPDVAFFSDADRRLQRSPRVAHLVTRFGIWDQPHEAQVFWDRFREGEDDALDAGDLSDEARAWFQRRVGRVLRIKRSQRFLAKYPRLSARVGWINEMFPDALFLHLVRDWRAVVNSALGKWNRRDNHRGKGSWYGVRIPGWREMKDDPHAVVSARQYRWIALELERRAEELGERFMTLSYEDLCDHPVDTVRSIANWTGLEWSDSYQGTIRPRLRSRNHKWKENLDEETLGLIRAEDPKFSSRFEFERPG